MLSITEADVVFGTQFTQIITVFAEETDPETGEVTNIPSTTVPVITKSFNDPGVTVILEVGQVTISGTYRSIIAISWEYIDLNDVVQSTNSTPTPGTFNKITKVDSPSNLTEDCIYTIDGETFTHHVSIPSYTVIADTLKTLLATIP
jgi:hypothetical protein